MSAQVKQAQSIAPYLLRRSLQKPVAGEAMPRQEGQTIHDIWAVLARRWATIASVLALIVGATSLYCFVIATPQYAGVVTVLVESRGPQILNNQRLDEVQDAFTSSKYDYYQTEFQLLRSPALAQRVIEDLDLAKNKAFAPVPAPMPTMIKTYLKNLVITPIRGTRLVTIEFDSTDAKLAADVATAHARLFVRNDLDRVYSTMDGIRSFLETKLAELQGKRQEAETNLLNFQSMHHLLPVDLNKDVMSERLMDLSRRLTAAEAERIALEAQYNVVQKREYDALPAVINSPLIQRLREDYTKLDVEHELVARKFRPTYPQLQQLTAQLDHAGDLLRKEVQKVVSGIETSFLAASRNAEQLKAELEEQRQKLIERKDDEGEFIRLTREVETTRALYDNLLTRVKDLNVTVGAQTSNLSVAEPATVPTAPAYPTKKLFLILGGLTGILLGTGLAFLRDSWDRTIRDVHDIRRTTGLGTLAVVPELDVAGPMAARDRFKLRAARAQRLARARFRQVAERVSANGNGATVTTAAKSPSLVLGNGHVSASAEAFRTLRTELLLCRPSSTPRVLLVASAVSGEGKTTTAVNTAAALASCGATVLLIDGDLRLSRCHEAIGLAEAPGLTEYLLGEMTDEPIQETSVERLSFLSAGRFVANPSELLTSWRMCKLLQHARERYDFVVIDSPPLLAVSDGLLLANLSDGVIVVTERGRSRHDHLRTILQRLHQTGAIAVGAVLNRGDADSEYYRYSRAVPEPMAAYTNGNGHGPMNGNGAGADGSEFLA
jgi:capsular exopolysaccharide synthesis family protein